RARPFRLRDSAASGGLRERAYLMKDDRKNQSYDRKAIAQFAPNFTVYVMLPDVVCLYSEDRKFFLHGELYCALASAIGQGGKSFGQLVRELTRRFPPDQVHEAFKRLLDRGYILAGARVSTGPVAAYWASLGLSPEIAKANLDKCKVRLHSLDV